MVAATRTLEGLRSEAEATWEADGLPNRKAEPWRWFHLRELARRELIAAPGEAAVDAGVVDRFALEGVAAVAVCVDGRFAPGLSRLDALPDGVVVASLVAAAGEGGGPGALVGTIQAHDGDGFAALNAARFEDGVYVEVPAGVVVDRPIQILHIATDAAEARATHTRHLAVAGRGSESTIIARYASLTAAPYVANVVTELALDDNASCRWVTTQEAGQAAAHVEAFTARLSRDARLRAFAMSLGASVARFGARVELAGQGASAALDGLYVAHERQRLDHYTELDHVVPHCASSELWAGVMDGRAVGSWQGVIYMREGARGSSTRQLNQNLLLSEGAVAHTKPQLEIDNDDVKAAHGATVGQLDPASRYYLEARGIAPEDAERILTLAFAREALAQVDHAPTQRAFTRLVAAKLGASDLLDADDPSEEGGR